MRTGGAQHKTSGARPPWEESAESLAVKIATSLVAESQEKAIELAASLAFFRKHAAMPMPSIPTPQFPSGLAKVTPRSTPSAVLKPGAPTKAVNTTQVHTQPPAVNSSPYSGVKSVPPPSVKR